MLKVSVLIWSFFGAAEEDTSNAAEAALDGGFPPFPSHSCGRSDKDSYGLSYAATVMMFHSLIPGSMTEA